MLRSVSSVYLDSSALVKLIIREPESELLEEHLKAHRVRISSDLATVEVIRTARKYRPEVVTRARQLLDNIRLLSLDKEILTRAGKLGPITLRSLDSIHLASAQSAGESVKEFVTYDRRLAGAARDLGFFVVAPGS